MAKLTAAKRKALPKSVFAGPNRSFPIPDRAHAANAKARASQAVKAGRMSSAEKARIDAKADRKLGEGSKKDRKTPNDRLADRLTKRLAKRDKY